MAITYDADGWSVVTKNASDKIVYVSSAGSDSYDGLSPTHTSGTNGPKLTPGSAYALCSSGTSDQILLRRGDTYSWSLNWTSKSGRSATEPMVLGAYSDGTTGHTDTDPRPIIVGGILVQGTSSRLAFLSIDFLDNGSRNAGLQFLSNGADILVEDCRAQNYYQGFIGYSNFPADLPVKRQTWRRCVSSGSDGGHGQGFFIGNIGSGAFLMEDCIAIDCGNPDGQSHCFYIDKEVEAGSSLTLRHNVGLPPYPTDAGSRMQSGTSEGLKSRQAGTINGNFMAFCAISYVFGTYDGDGSGFTPPDRPLLYASQNVSYFPCDLDSGHGIRGHHVWLYGFDSATTGQFFQNNAMIGNLSPGNDKVSIYHYPWTSNAPVKNIAESGNATYNAGGPVTFLGTQAAFSGIAFSGNKLRESGNTALVYHQNNTSTNTTYSERANNSFYSGLGTSGMIDAPSGNNLTAYGATQAGSVGEGYLDPTRSFITFVQANGGPTLSESAARDYVADIMYDLRRYSYDDAYSPTAIVDYFLAGLSLPITGEEPPTPSPTSSMYYLEMQGAI